MCLHLNEQLLFDISECQTHVEVQENSCNEKTGHQRAVVIVNDATPVRQYGHEFKDEIPVGDGPHHPDRKGDQ